MSTDGNDTNNPDTKAAASSPQIETSSEDLLKMYLAGTIAIPAQPAKAKIAVEQQGSGRDGFYLVKAVQCVSAKVTVTRTFFQDDVKAVYANGDWTAGESDVNRLLKEKLGERPFDGVLYVREDAQSLLETKAGLTAAENAEYYPPMPQERSTKHYNLSRGRTGCLHDECCDYPPDPPDNGGDNCGCGGGDCCC